MASLELFASFFQMFTTRQAAKYLPTVAMASHQRQPTPPAQSCLLPAAKELRHLKRHAQLQRLTYPRWGCLPRIKTKTTCHSANLTTPS